MVKEFKSMSLKEIPIDLYKKILTKQAQLWVDNGGDKPTLPETVIAMLKENVASGETAMR